ncbi:hypothetical protein SEMRO_1942_G306740.1 [Seminavis robusta]|uniref:Uncharacterized protein n=1 Tax=Seminavis robusta TaxID=568900 RepID=A0A9N8EVF6_9STRA|nr:hypothetical protein SEMRO_1942_G306740.1 [Seminavis robusta]|eukprot:Sro1942_g306740.1 n/a (163) ;mRNA; r:7069-7557
MAAEAFNARQFLAFGMDILGVERWEFLKETSVIERFTNAYGAKPITCEQMWTDLISMGEVNKKSKPMHLFIALRFLYKNDTELDLMSFFKIGSDNTIRKWCWSYVKKIQKLLKGKMLTWEEADDGMIFFLTVDGTHCPIEEPRPFSKIWSSHKFGGDAALNY